MSNKHTKFAEELMSVRPTTRNLITSILMDAWPTYAAVVDFGIAISKSESASAARK